ncbi:MAG: leucine-rich repeat domain-containing protein [Mycoplasmoidaceae bacterium]|nr:leucine-rich repeat domain-containing protein [Mycoplasmoidaceae bacterium]
MYIPKNVTQIDEEAFYNCPNFNRLVFSSALNGALIDKFCIYKNAFAGCSGFEGELTFPSPTNGKLLIDEGAFDGCSSFTSINFLSFNLMYSTSTAADKTDSKISQLSI